MPSDSRFDNFYTTPFLEAIRQIRNDKNISSALIHMTYVPFLSSAGELKTKPTQHSVKELLNSGIQPDMIMCRCEKEINEESLEKISQFCNVKKESVIPALNALNPEVNIAAPNKIINTIEVVTHVSVTTSLKTFSTLYALQKLQIIPIRKVSSESVDAESAA